MPYSFSFGQTITVSANVPGSSQSIESENRAGFNGIVAAADSDRALGVSFPITNLKAVHITASKNMTLKTNSSGGPQETIVIGPDKPAIQWMEGQTPAVFAGDVTEIYVTNDDGEDGSLYIEIGYDPVV